MRYKRIIAAATALAVIASTGCNSRDKKDAEIIEQIPVDLIEAFREEDTDRIAELAGGLDMGNSFDVLREYLGDDYEVFEVFVSGVEVVQTGEIEFDREKGTASMDTTIAYPDVDEINDALGSDYATAEELIDALNSTDSTNRKTFNLNFEYDEENDEWTMSKKSARKIIDYIMDRVNRFPTLVEISRADAQALFEQYLSDIAAQGYSDITVYTAQESFQVYDNVVIRGEGEQTQAAVRDFAAAYMSYVLSHDYTIEETDPYSFELTGCAPSDEDLIQSLESPEFMEGYYRNIIRYEYLGMDLDDMWEDQSTRIYTWLESAVEIADPEEYTLSAYISPWDPDSGLNICGDIIVEPARGIFEVEHGITWEEFEQDMTIAIECLHTDGELSDNLYNSLLNNLTPENYGYTTAGGTNSSGHPDQAVGTYEQVPEWCDDGSLVYGYSNPDENGFWMFYSKEPGYLDTVGYYIGDGGIWITNYYDCTFDSGDVLEVDWWIDGDQVVSAQQINITEDGTYEVEVFLPWNNVNSFSECEMRLWLPGHNHVISYVTLSH